jgi:hypothetical protein
MQPFLDRYYSVADWRLAAVFSIRAEHASGYVERIVNDKRALMKSRPRTGRRRLNGAFFKVQSPDSLVLLDTLQHAT